MIAINIFLNAGVKPMGATAPSYKMLEEAGFNNEQARILIALIEQHQDSTVNQEIKALDKDVTNKIQVSESRIESVLKDFKLEIIREIHTSKTELDSRVTAFKDDIGKQINDLSKRLETFKDETNERLYNLKDELHELKSDVSAIKGDVRLIRGVGTLIIGLGSIIGVAITVLNYFAHLPK